MHLDEAVVRPFGKLGNVVRRRSKRYPYRSVARYGNARAFVGGGWRGVAGISTQADDAS